MQLISVHIARSVWLFPTEGLNPRGLETRSLLGAIKDRYAFQKVPDSPEDISQPSGGLEFLGGSFLYDQQQIQIVSLKIFNDGLIAETRYTTEASDAVLDDALNYAVHSFGWTFNQNMVKRKAYYSELVVEGSLNINLISDKLQRISSLLPARSATNRFTAISLRFGVDPTVDGGTNVPQFVIEKRAGVSFTDDRYFCQAPMTTSEHLEILAEVEKIISE